MIYINFFEVVSFADPSVGIFQTRWTIQGGFHFEDEEELEQFRSDLKETFEQNVGDISHVETSLEIWQNELRYQKEIISTVKDQIARILDADEINYKKLAEFSHSIADEIDRLKSIETNIEKAKQGG